MRNLVNEGGDPRMAVVAAGKRGRTWVGLLSLVSLLALVLPTTGQARDAQAIIQELCIACHTMDGNAVVPAFPKLAGLHAAYLEKQLSDFANGYRKQEPMESFAKQLSPKEIRTLANYFSAQRRHDGVVTEPDLLERGREIFHEGDKENGVPACAGCHKPDGSGTPRSVMIAGQNAPYVAQQLTMFKNDERTNDRGMLMRTVAGRLTQEEIQAVAQYVASMR
ncbi:cytochrome c553 [Thioflavicoccus mobilis 8321]|uniref:Cytochrome c553 n=1 Tax=Thioflavicoccus mobilis 8321 TaxID=765912 RepID=L0GZY7_9GAMM|nr:c-type cytochrome [Thioflavicoccus mobilis]AGA91516.1 cytochrome c553 [Thioflavicoccus mobilis 8321]